MLTFCIFQRSTASSSKFISDLILYVVQDLSIKIKLNKEVRFTHPLKLYYCHQKTVLLRGTNISHLLTCHLLIFIYETRFLTWKNCLISQYSICYRIYLQRWVRKNFSSNICTRNTSHFSIFVFFFHFLFLVLHSTMKPRFLSANNQDFCNLKAEFLAPNSSLKLHFVTRVFFSVAFHLVI